MSSVWEGGEGEAGRATMNFPPHPLVLPDNVGVHCDKIFTCNGVSELPMSIPPLSSDTESSLYTPLIEGLNSIYKWNMDTVITVDRESSTLSRDELPSNNAEAPIIMVGGSNAGRLGVSLDNIGKPTVVADPRLRQHHQGPIGGGVHHQTRFPGCNLRHGQLVLHEHVQ